MKQQIPVNNLPKGEHEFKVIPLGHFTPYDFQRPHRHSYFELFIFEKGGGSHFIDFVEHEIKDLSVHIVFPQQIHLVKRTETAKGFVVICSKDFVNLLGKYFIAQMTENFYHHPGLQFEPKDFSAILNIVAILQEESKSDSILSSGLIQNYTAIFLTHCLRNTQHILPAATTQANYNLHEWETFKKFSALLDTHFLDKATVSYYAEQLAMTTKVLNNCVKKVSGKTCVELLQEKTLTEAKRLMLYTDESIKEIAYKLNFKDSSYFTRFFTRQEGRTPKDFKAYWEQKYHS